MTAGGLIETLGALIGDTIEIDGCCEAAPLYVTLGAVTGDVILIDTVGAVIGDTMDTEEEPDDAIELFNGITVTGVETASMLNWDLVCTSGVVETLFPLRFLLTWPGFKPGFLGTPLL